MIEYLTNAVINVLLGNEFFTFEFYLVSGIFVVIIWLFAIIYVGLKTLVSNLTK